MMKIEERRKRVKELYEEGKIQSEIVEELQVADSTISRDIKYLKEKGEITTVKREAKTIERRKRVKELYEEGKTQSEIAKELHISNTTISRDIQFLEGKDKISIKKLCEDFYGQRGIKKIFKKYISDCKDKFEQGTLQKKELETIKDGSVILN